ncbi:MAG: GHKL domain-containing protein [Clostridium sp.]|nr:GHKL domain-containing protein [Clostridium sp.]
MKEISSTVVLYLFNLISTYFMFLGYSFISKEKFKYNFKNIVCVIITSTLFLINNSHNSTIIKVPIIILNLLIFFKIVFNGRLRNIVIYTFTLYLALVFFDFMFSFIFHWLNAITAPDLSRNYLIMGGFTLLITFLTSLFCKLKFVRKFSDLIINLSKNNYVNVLVISLIILFIVILSTKLSLEYDYEKFLFNLLLLSVFLFFIVFAFVKNYLAQKEKQEKETLLEFISKYEKIIDENRINKHEMLNNLIILRSFKDKNTEEYNKVLDDLIVTYDNNSDACIKNISKLTTGLKGILYYKINDMRNKNINLNVNISKRVSSPLEKLPLDEYVILSRIIGIVMDNALEASIKSKEKFVMIEVFEQNDNVIIIIENSYNNKVNVNDLKKKNFSTKGKSRGLGLYIANMLLKKSKHIEMTQHAEELFITKLTIK